MKKILMFCLVMVLCSSLAHSEDKKVLCGFDGGMMIHTGYLWGDIAPLNFKISGIPVGIGGVIRIHLGEHWRIGGEGYMSSLSQLNNGSYIKFGWGGVVGDFYWTFKRFMPYVGLTLGGGMLTDFLMMKAPASEWEPAGEAYHHKQGFVAIDPFVGCDYIISEAFHLTLKADWLCGAGKKADIPVGPRLYIGFIFYH